MVKLRSEYRIHQYIMAKWKVSKRTVERWEKEVRAQWAAAAEAEPDPQKRRERRRNQMRADLDTAMAEAMNRTMIVKDSDGNPMLDPREMLPTGEKNPNYQRPITRPHPDIQRFLHACNQLRHLDGLDEPAKAQLHVTGLGDSLPDLDSLPEVARKHLVAGLHAMAPDGDLRKLAGDLFAASAKAERLN